LALEAIQTPLVGYLGAHVILHDGRTSGLLSTLVDEPTVVSASCVLVSAEKRGKSWHVAVADPGTMNGRSNEGKALPDDCQSAQLMWRATYPTLRPPRDLWVSRSSTARNWLQRAGPLRPQEGTHSCTSVVTASYLKPRDDRPSHLLPPAAAEECAIQTRVLFG
jgi:hypothetical protein